MSGVNTRTPDVAALLNEYFEKYGFTFKLEYRNSMRPGAWDSRSTGRWWNPLYIYHPEGFIDWLGGPLTPRLMGDSAQHVQTLWAVLEDNLRILVPNYTTRSYDRLVDFNDPNSLEILKEFLFQKRLEEVNARKNGSWI